MTVNFINGKHTVTALDTINVGLNSGQIYALFGPSGSGKTTLLNVFSGLVTPTSGTVYFQDQPLYTNKDQLARYRRDHVGLVFQNLLLVDHLNTIENIMIGSDKVSKEAITQTEDLMRYLGIFNIRNLDVNMLSGGERQRVAIARCLVQNPDIVLMDEPTANLDYYNAQRIMELARDIAVSGNKCVVVVTHDSRLLTYVDQVIKLLDGRLAVEQ